MRREQALLDFSTFRPLNFYTLFFVSEYVSWLIIYRNLNKICILILCESCINLNYVELLHGAFHIYYILQLLCLFILSIFESFILKLQLKIFSYLKIIVIYSAIISNFVLFQVFCQYTIIISLFKK